MYTVCSHNIIIAANIVNQSPFCNYKEVNGGVRLATLAVLTVSLAQTLFEFHEFEAVDFLLQPERAVLEYKLSAWYTARRTCWGNVVFVRSILSTNLLVQQKSFPLILLTEMTGLVLSYKTMHNESFDVLEVGSRH